MGYAEVFARHHKNGANDNLVQRYLSFAEGQTAVGELLAITLKTISEDKPPVNSYSIMTNEGPASFLLGGATDKQLEGKIHPGDLISVTYLGKQPIKAGKQQVNLWDVFSVPAGKWEDDSEVLSRNDIDQMSEE